MTPAVSQSLPAALGIVLSTAPILAIVLLLVTTRPARVSFMFLLGWAAGILAVAGVVVTCVDTSVQRGLPPAAAAITRIILGAALALLAVRSWRRRRQAGADDVPPKWISSIGGWSWSRTLAIGFALGSVNPKNLALVVSGATAILEATTARREQALAVVVFVGVASLGVATPIVLRAVGGRAVNRGLERAGEWMAAHGKTLSSIVLALIAIVLMINGVGRLERHG